jgi:hypothetical protein
MTAINWKNAVTGDWSTPADWSTNTVPGSGDAVTVSVAGSYVVSISSAAFANSLTFTASLASLFENAGSLTMAGVLTVDSGFVSLNRANTIGSVALAGGTLAFGAGGALGAGTVSLSGGELLATANQTLTNGLMFIGNSTITAAHGTTLNENASSMSIGANATLNFGALGQDGTILWHTPSNTSFSSPLPAINIQAGTLKGADATFGFFLEDEAVSVAAGATLDLAGNSVTISNLTGGGAIVDSGAPDTITLLTANFSDVISGAQTVIANGTVTLSGNITYSGTTTIRSGVGFELGLGGTTGSIGGGAIADAGTLYIFRSNALCRSGPFNSRERLAGRRRRRFQRRRPCRHPLEQRQRRYVDLEFERLRRLHRQRPRHHRQRVERRAARVKAKRRLPRRRTPSHISTTTHHRADPNSHVSAT